MKPIFTKDMSMDEIMRAWPGTIPVILRHGMLCVGCPIAPFHTVSDACREHGVDASLFLDDLKRKIASNDAPA